MHTGNPSNGEKVAEIRLKSISVHTKKRMHKTSGQFISIYFSLYSQNSAPNYHATIQTPYGTPLLGFPVPIKMATRSACWIFTGTFFLVFQAVVLIRPGPYFLHYLAPNLFEYIYIVAETSTWKLPWVNDCGWGNVYWWLWIRNTRRYQLSRLNKHRHHEHKAIFQSNKCTRKQTLFFNRDEWKCVTRFRADFSNALYFSRGLTCTLGLANDLIDGGQPRDKNGF